MRAAKELGSGYDGPSLMGQDRAAGAQKYWTEGALSVPGPLENPEQRGCELTGVTSVSAAQLRPSQKDEDITRLTFPTPEAGLNPLHRTGLSWSQRLPSW